MDSQNEIDLIQLARTIWRRKLVLAVCSVSFAVTGLIAGLLLPRLYQSQSLVLLPETVKYSRNNDYTKVITTLLSTAETRALVAFIRGDADSADAALLGKMASVTIDEVRGSNEYFKMKVTARNDPAAARSLSQRILAYLQTRPVVCEKLDAERHNLEAYLRQTDESIKRAGRDHVSGADLDRLRETRYLLQAALAQIHNYRFASEPVLNAAPVGPRVILSTILYAMLGLLAGSAVVLVSDSIKRTSPRP